ncbi:hypothetical protein C4K22_1882 [Pseudomonas chlororaphis subsp. aurantiaca]|uniref:hypothetical protein n=1 Tax=Pseudomonas chlororaphis TaxID=587753 RepID=UPI000F575263|nr:hypothetical protein [Pseudomonas chlororaphis]AZD34635.1 hypothetical protein C4K22_1882 [Pseudomonas chlororaphis subsp. aurantiaca]AZD40970.1 hypothetical protein C4K21_1886 [Pseudomonas chlororaphis subsp. aurantiaca]
MQVNQPQGGTQEATTNPFKVGDKVSYVTLKAEGSGYSFSARNGVIVEIDGQVATVRPGNGRTITLPLKKLTPDGQPNALTRALIGGS